MNTCEEKSRAIALKWISPHILLVSTLEITLFTALTIAAAYIRIPDPNTPVPITFQVFVVLLAGVMIGGTKGTLSQMLYLGLGGIGLPVFAGGCGGFAYLFGCTGGYLLSFMFTPFLVGTLAGDAKKNVLRLSLSFLAGVLFIHSLGVLWLSVYTAASLQGAFILGSSPFLRWDALKIVLAVSTCKSWSSIQRR